MKIRLSELRRVIREEAAAAASPNFRVRVISYSDLENPAGRTTMEDKAGPFDTMGDADAAFQGFVKQYAGSGFIVQMTKGSGTTLKMVKDEQL